MADNRLTSLEDARAILILEFINAEQFPGQIRSSVPFLKGYANWLHKPCRWVRFALDSAHFFQHGKDAVTLTLPELDGLQRHIQALPPDSVDLVVTTHALGEEVAGKLKALTPQARVVLLDELEWTRQWPKGPLPMEMSRPGYRPDYLWEAGNSQALRNDRNNIYILGSVGCGYRKSVRNNPFYTSLHLPDSLMGGCAFCGARMVPGQMLEALAEGGKECEPHIRQWRELVAGSLQIPLDFVRLQIETIAQTMLPDRCPNALLFSDIERPDILHKAVETLSQHQGLAGVKLLAGLRVDRLLQLEPWLRQEFCPPVTPPGETTKQPSTSNQDAMAPLPHRLSLQLFSCGLENFSADELQRMNKGTTPLMNLRAVNLLKELETASEGRFYYSGYMGLSVLLFTPWTTLEELHLNASLLLHLGLEDEVGNLFLSRLRLHPDLAITLLARQDGVVVPHEEDPALVLNRRKLFEEELAWRHLDPRMEAVSRVAVRLEPDSRLENDPLYHQIHTLLLPQARLLSAGGSRAAQRKLLVAVLLALVESAIEHGKALAPSKLVEAASQRLGHTTAALQAGRFGPRRWATLLSPDAAATWAACAASAEASAEETAGLALLFDLTNDQGEVVQLTVASMDEDGLCYTQVHRLSDVQAGVGSQQEGAPLCELLARGNRLRLRPGQIQVLRDQNLVAVFSTTVGLWSPLKAWHAAEWQELALAACRNSDPRAAEAHARVERQARRWIADPVILGGAPHA